MWCAQTKSGQMDDCTESIAVSLQHQQHVLNSRQMVRWPGKKVTLERMGSPLPKAQSHTRDNWPAKPDSVISYIHELQAEK